MIKKEQGMALLVILLIISLMMILAVNINERWQRSLQRTENIQNQMQAKWYVLAGEELVRLRLIQDLKDSDNKVHLAQVWATQGQVFPLENATMEMVALDEQACFNVNAINADKPDSAEDDNETAIYPAKIFKELLINLEISDYDARQITDALSDWVDDDDIQSRYGAESGHYSSLTPPYFAANSLMKNISELRAIKGIDADVYQKLRSFVCALPNEKLTINVNTIRDYQAPLFAAIFLNRFSNEDIKGIISKRPREGWDTVNDFLQLEEIQDANVLFDKIRELTSINSKFFRLLIRVQYNDFEYQISSLLSVVSQKIIVVERQFGTSQIKAGN